MEKLIHSALGTTILAFLFIPAVRSQTLPGNIEPPGQSQPARSQWSYALDVQGYLIPDNVSYASPVFTADHNWLHLEARYNYEALQTASLWAGYNLNAGHTVSVSVTPMLGAVFGDTNGIAPGYEFSLTWRKLELTSDGEYVYAPTNSDQSFLYSWDELVYSPTEWLHAGLVAQRTRAHQTELDVQRGFSVGVAHKQVDFTVYTFNAGWTDPTVMLNLNWTF
jgi:hypothetical protein